MPLPPLDFLLEASPTSLQDLELAALNHSAMISKAIKHELQAWIEREATAMLARWMIENRDKLLREQIEIKPQKVDFVEAARVRKSA